MKQKFPRKKPHPLPAIRPVAEYDATGTLAVQYEETKQALQVPWMGVVAMSFAHYPNFWGVLWKGMRALVQSEEFVAACRRLRLVTENAVAEIPARDLVAELQSLGYGEKEIVEIRALIEVFSHGNMPYLLIATTARILLEGGALSVERGASHHVGRHAPPAPARLTLMEPHHADPSMAKVFTDIRQTLALPFVNTDYRALARWPSYFKLAWGELKPVVGSVDHLTACDMVHSEAVSLALSLPNPAGLSSEPLKLAADRDASIPEVLEVVRLFQFLLPELAVNIACLRAQLRN